MIRRDARAKFVYQEVGFFRKRLRWYFLAGRKRTEKDWDDTEQKRLLVAQSSLPVRIMEDADTRRSWWIYLNEFYWEDEGYTAEAVQALVLQRIGKRNRRVEKALVFATYGHEADRQSRESISDEVKMFVWRRDGGRCVRCNSNFNLEFDHIIPLCQGGSNSARNLQLLCESCNRSKGGNI